MSFKSIRIIASYSFEHQRSICAVTGDGCLVFPAKPLLYSLLIYCFLNGKLFFRSQTDLKLIYLWASVTLELWLVIHFQHQKSICRVTGDGWLVFPAKQLLYSLLICCWWMENNFLEVKKTTNSFTYVVQWHWHYVRLYMNND